MKLTSQDEKIALIGSPLGHSKSSEMINTTFCKMDIPFVYIPFHISRSIHLKDVVKSLKVLGFKGWNVTIPYKMEILPYLDGLDETAKEVASVNTVVYENGRYIGYNTDGEGYLRSLENELSLDLSSQYVVILGSGGAAHSIGISLAKQGVKQMTIVNRTIEKAQKLSERCGVFTSSEAVSLDSCEEKVKRATLLINTTPVGMYPYVKKSAIPLNYIHANLTVSDCVYNPKETTLLAHARQKGATVHHGLGMFVNQAAAGIQLWTKKMPSVEFMREILEG